MYTPIQISQIDILLLLIASITIYYVSVQHNPLVDSNICYILFHKISLNGLSARYRFRRCGAAGSWQPDHYMLDKSVHMAGLTPHTFPGVSVVTGEGFENAQ
jgi:hypothetical protein